MRIAPLAVALLFLPAAARAQATPIDPCRNGWTAWDWRECQRHLLRNTWFPEVAMTPPVAPSVAPPRESENDRYRRERERERERCRERKRSKC